MADLYSCFLHGDHAGNVCPKCFPAGPVENAENWKALYEEEKRGRAEDTEVKNANIHLCEERIKELERGVCPNCGEPITCPSCGLGIGT